jgi:hypothetical protein
LEEIVLIGSRKYEKVHFCDHLMFRQKEKEKDLSVDPFGFH